MTVHYSDEWLTVLHGDVRDELRTLSDESVHCVVTSPPYWGLRDYGTATWEGGDPECDHKPPLRPRSERPNPSGAGIGKGDYPGQAPKYSTVCGKCGAVRLDNQLGLEPTPEQYVENMVAVFREVRRVLRSDGTLWLNLGDSYASHDPGGYRQGEFLNPGGREPVKGQARNRAGNYRPPGLKPKDLVGIPWRVAFALQADGWYLRSDIVWSKPNPMPESVTDRPTKSHEYLFLLSKSARYYFDSDAVREDPSESSLARIAQPTFAQQTGGPKDYANGTNPNRSARKTLENFAANPGRNIRSVWTIATAPYPGAHFATFPPKLVEPCIKAGTSEKGVCPECGRPWERVTRVIGDDGREAFKTGRFAIDEDGEPITGDNRKRGAPTPHVSGTLTRAMPPVSRSEHHGWQPSCRHVSPLPPQPAVCLDPFAGSGTTGMVAQSLSRRAVLIDLNVDYLGQLMERNREIPLGLEAS